MFKKIATTVILVGALSIGNGVFAEDALENTELENGVVEESPEEDVTEEENNGHENSEIVTPLSNLYEAIRQMQDATIYLTKGPAEKALLQIELAEKRVAEAKVMIGNGIQEVADQLLIDSEKSADEAELVLEEAEEMGEDVSDVKEIITEMNAKRSQNLLALLDRENLPEQAKDGIRKALANQARAVERSNKNKAVVVEVDESIDEKTENNEGTTKIPTEEASQENVATAEVQTTKQVEKANQKVEKTVEKANQRVEKADQKGQKAVEKAVEQATKAQEKASNGRP
ncbi:DUF5667 domain-containing protein [Bacillaceae bacterium IKA-2]|nr:DUF5667 domain-containing protein [Bacillaceae bacterium IKA-2]